MNLSVFANVLKPAQQLCIFVLKLVNRGYSQQFATIYLNALQPHRHVLVNNLYG